jgi:L-asparagine transporter-like permease
MQWALRVFGLRGPATHRVPSRTELWVYAALSTGGLALNIAVHQQPFSAIGGTLLFGGLATWLMTWWRRAKARRIEHADSHGQKKR